MTRVTTALAMQKEGKTGNQDKPEGGRGWDGVWEDGL